MRIKIDGLTWYQWARMYFEFENCCECGKGVKGHKPSMLFGKWLAICKSEVA